MLWDWLNEYLNPVSLDHSNILFNTYVQFNSASQEINNSTYTVEFKNVI